MANPRTAISFEGLDAHYSTYASDGSTIVYDATKANGSAFVGLAVTESAAGVVALAADGDAIFGKLILVEPDGKCNVQDRGYCQLPGGTGAVLTRGFKFVGALLVAAKGYIREVASATPAELNKGRGRIVDATDAAAVWVEL